MRLALRSLARRPGFTLVAVAALAVGFGVNTALFSVVNALLLRPMPYADAERLVVISGTSRQFDGPLLASPAELAIWREHNTVFRALAASAGESVTIAWADRLEELPGAQVSADLLPLLQVPPRVGQPFAPDDFASGAPSRVLISDRLWRTLTGSDPRIAGASIVLNGEAAVVLGVMPPGFHFPAADTDIWRPLRINAAQPGANDRRMLDIYGSLKPGATAAQAQTNLLEISRVSEPGASIDGRGDARGNQGADGRGDRGGDPRGDRRSLEVTPLHERISANVRPTLKVLLGMVSLVLLIACAHLLAPAQPVLHEG